MIAFKEKNYVFVCLHLDLMHLASIHERYIYLRTYKTPEKSPSCGSVEARVYKNS